MFATSDFEGPTSSPLLPTGHSSLGPPSPPQSALSTDAANIAPPPALSQKTLHRFFNLSTKRAPQDLTHQPTRPLALKRQRSRDESVLPVLKKSRPQGTSKSALAEARDRADADMGIVNEDRFQTFKNKILSLDSYAEFRVDNNPRAVRHSKCGEISMQKTPYNISVFTNHLQTCPGPPKIRLHAGNTNRKTFDNLFARNTPRSPIGRVTQPHPSHNVSLPCPGLTSNYDSKITNYLTRSQAAGGGSRARPAISQEKFGKPLGQLNKEEFARVRQIEAGTFRWINFREQGFVRAALCLRESPSRQEPAAPCRECVLISKDQIFKNALARKLPEDENLKFTPHGHRATLTGKQYAKTVGVYDLVNRASKVSHLPYNHHRSGVTMFTGGDRPISVFCPWDAPGRIQGRVVLRYLRSRLSQGGQGTAWGWNAKLSLSP
jgi:hypothetical protein